MDINKNLEKMDVNSTKRQINVMGGVILTIMSHQTMLSHKRGTEQISESLFREKMDETRDHMSMSRDVLNFLEEKDVDLTKKHLTYLKGVLLESTDKKIIKLEAEIAKQGLIYTPPILAKRMHSLRDTRGLLCVVIYKVETKLKETGDHL